MIAHDAMRVDRGTPKESLTLAPGARMGRWPLATGRGATIRAKSAGGGELLEASESSEEKLRRRRIPGLKYNFFCYTFSL